MKPLTSKAQAAMRRRNRNHLALAAAILRENYNAHSTADAVDEIVGQLNDSLESYRDMEEVDAQ